MKIRQLKMDFSRVRPHWAPNAEFAQAQNASSLMPVHVEPYLIKVMKRAREELGPEHARLKEDINVFIRQETQHYKQHQLFNQALYDAGYDRLPEFEKELREDYERFLAQMPLKFNCVYCEGFETLGPPNAYCYFSGFGGLLEGADESAVDLWKWHMAEEFEHRHVCYEVYKALFGKTLYDRWLYRIYGVFAVVKHLNGWGHRVGQYLIEKDRAGMTPEQLEASQQRERAYKRKLLLHFLPRLLPALSPFYNPARKRAPAGMEAWMERIEARYDAGAGSA
jgi:predicted metal-dependent hydrolase